MKYIYMYAPLPNFGPMNWIDAMEHLDKNPLLITLAVLILADVITGISKSLVISTTDSSIGKKKGFSVRTTIVLLVWLLCPWSIAIGYEKLLHRVPDKEVPYNTLSNKDL